MKNIPVFMSGGGTATIILQEVPKSGKAYVILQTIIPECLDTLLNDCKQFCIGAGAKIVYVSDGKKKLPLPHCYDLLVLTAPLPVTRDYRPIRLIPLTEETGMTYISIYNLCFEGVSHALSYDRQQLKRIEAMQQRAYLAVDENGDYIGIGELHEGELAAVAVVPEARGIGTDLTCTLLSLLEGNEVMLTVVSDNARALHMYEKLDFHVHDIESSWYLLN